MTSKYQSQRVRFSQIRKVNELNAINEIVDQFRITWFGFTQSVVSDHECLCIHFIARVRGSLQRAVVELIPSAGFPYEEPGSVLLEPDIRRLPVRSHTYSDFGGRLLCVHMRQWHRRCSLAKFFISAVIPWVETFLA